MEATKMPRGEVSFIRVWAEEFIAIRFSPPKHEAGQRRKSHRFLRF
jgi:hypothetical protein